jgi:FAD:protein FMN transferase
MNHAPTVLTEAPPSEEIVRLACRAMASRFELVLHGDEPAFLRAAGEEALAEIERLHARLTRFSATSDIGRINARAATEPVRVDSRLFNLLADCKKLHEETRGAFDITVGPLMQLWSQVHHTGRIPDAETLDEARSRTGMHLVELDAETRSVRFRRPGVTLDLGAVGKGYAVDEAMLILRDLGIRSAFLHGGTSTMAAIGSPPDAESWNVAIPHPRDAGTSEEVLCTVALRDASLSVSAVWGRAFVADDVSYGHVLDPRLGRPVDAAVLAAVLMPSATRADALSTALLVLADDGAPLAEMYSDLQALVVKVGGKSNPTGFSSPARLQSGVTIWESPNYQGSDDATR